MILMKLYDRIKDQKDVISDRENLSVYNAYWDDELIGYCTFYYEDETVVISYIATRPRDKELAIGLARAAVAAGENRMKKTVRLEEGGPEVDDFMNSVDSFSNRQATIESILYGKECKEYNE